MKDDRVYLGHIRDAIHDIERYTAGGRDTFMADRMQQDAVIRKLEIIGEAVKHLSEQTTSRRPEIPWKRIAGMRIPFDGISGPLQKQLLSKAATY